MLLPNCFSFFFLLLSLRTCLARCERGCRRRGSDFAEGTVHRTYTPGCDYQSTHQRAATPRSRPTYTFAATHEVHTERCERAQSTVYHRVQSTSRRAGRAKEVRPVIADTRCGCRAEQASVVHGNTHATPARRWPRVAALSISRPRSHFQNFSCAECCYASAHFPAH